MGQAPSSPAAAASGTGDGEGGCAETVSGAEPPSCAVLGCGAVARAMGWFAGSAPVAAIHRFPLSCNPYRFGEKIFPRHLRSAYSYPDPSCHAGGSHPAPRSFPRRLLRLQKSSFWGLEQPRTAGPHRRVTWEQPEVWKRLETEAQLSPQVPMKIAFWGVKACQPPGRALTSPAQPPPLSKSSRQSFISTPQKPFPSTSPRLNPSQNLRSSYKAIDKNLCTHLMLRHPSANSPIAQH